MATLEPGLSGFSTRLMPNSTSCAVSGSPSDQRSPSRRWNTYRRPSSEISQRSARLGTMVRPGLVLVGRRQPVVRQKAEDLLLVAGVALLEPFCRPAMQPLAFGGEHGRVSGLLDQGVLESELRDGPSSPLPDEVQSLQLVEG